MNKTRQVMQQALRALEKAQVRADMYAVDNAIDALRAALAEPEQEPVAWVLVTPYGEEDDIFYTEPETVPDGWSYKPLYDTAPTPRKPLTDEEIRRIYETHKASVPLYHAIARAIERAHGIGEQHGS